MSMFKKIALLITSVTFLLLLTFTLLAMTLFQRSTRERIIVAQQLLTEANTQIYHSFSRAIDQMAYQFTSDEMMGDLLSHVTGRDDLSDLNTKSGITRQLRYFLNSQASLADAGFSNVLYVNPRVPIAGLLETNEETFLSPSISLAYSAEEFQAKDWYKHALGVRLGQYVYIDSVTGHLCFAKKVQNTFYRGPFLPDGLGVLVTSIPINQLIRVLSFSEITENSYFGLMSPEQDVLFLSKPETDRTYSWQDSRTLSDNRLEMNGEKFLYSRLELDWGVELLFLTPESDIDREITRTVTPFLIISLGFLCFGVLAAVFLALGISRPVVRLAHAIEGIDNTREADLTHIPARDDEIRLLISSFEGLFLRVNQLIDDIHAEEAIRRESELRALQAQINPHFMLNAMNTVNWMALEQDQDDIADTVSSIANLMRYSITEPHRPVSISEELKNVEEYIAIYTLRFGPIIRLHVDSSESTENLIIPKFTLQPLIENSIRHGISKDEEAIDVFVRILTEAGGFRIEVTDTGRGADPAKLNDHLSYKPTDLEVAHGFGIRNVNERLELSYGTGSGLHYETDAAGHLKAVLTIRNEENPPQIE